MAERSGVMLQPDTKTSALKGEAPSQTLVFREFGGVNLQSPRDAIGDSDFYWLEELIPIAPGNLLPTLGPSAVLTTVAGETGAPTYTLPFQINGVEWNFAVWANSGNAWVGKYDGTGWVKIINGSLTSGNTAAVAWGGVGLLIIDPTAGYFDYNVTTASTLTTLTGRIYGVSMNNLNPSVLGGGGPTPTLRVVDFGGAGSGAAVAVSNYCVGVAVSAGGANYRVGDVLQVSGGTFTTASQAPVAQQNQPTVLTVTGVSAGAVTSVVITNVGYYDSTPAGAAAVTGGSGSGATFTLTWLNGFPYIVTPGKSYTQPFVQVLVGASWLPYSMTVLSNGTLSGTSIAVYAGRVWIGSGRTVLFTDAASYNSFANSGGSFTINDDYLTGNVTALQAENGYLYIFGPTSIDILSNVQVVGGVAQFSRINASSSVGTSQPRSIFSLLRALCFSNNSGFYSMTGATPDKISDELDGLVAAINFGTPVWGGAVMVQNILCAAFLVSFVDNFVGTGQTRSILCLRFRGKWWFTSQLPASAVNLSSIVSIPVNGLSSLYGWAGPSLYSLLSTANTNSFKFVSKLWDMGAPIFKKQAMRVGAGMDITGGASASLSLTVDNENGSRPVAFSGPLQSYIQWVNQSAATVTWVQGALVSTVPTINNIVRHPVDWLEIGNYFIDDGRQGGGSTNPGVDPNLTEGPASYQFQQFIERSLTVNVEDGSIACRWQIRWPQFNSLGHSTDPLVNSNYNEVKTYPSIIFGAKPGYHSTSNWPAFSFARRAPDGVTVPDPSSLSPPAPIAADWQPAGGSVRVDAPCGASPNSSILPMQLPVTGKTARLRGKLFENAPPTGRGHLSYDMFLTANTTQGNNFTNAPITHEMMIPLRFWGGYGKYGNRSPSWYDHDVTIDGVLYHVYVTKDLGRNDSTGTYDFAGPGPGGSYPGLRYTFGGLNPTFTNEETGVGRIGWKFIVFEFDAPDGHGGQLDSAFHPTDADGYWNIDYTKFLAHAAATMDSRGIHWLQNTEYIPAIEIGIEQVWGTADAIVYNYSCQFANSVVPPLPKPAGAVQNTGVTVLWRGIQVAGYQFLFASSDQGGGYFLGITGVGSVANVSRIHVVALDYQKRNSW